MSSTSCSDSVSRVTVLIALMPSTEPTTLPQRKLSSFLLASLNDSFTHVYSFEYVAYTYSHTGNYDTYRIILGQLVLDGSDSSMVSAGTGGCLLDLDVLPLARLPATMVVSFGQGAGVHAGELVHSQVEELVEAELCLHATAAPSRATKRASSRSPARHRRSTQARRLHWPYDTPFNHAVLVMGYDVRRREN